MTMHSEREDTQAKIANEWMHESYEIFQDFLPFSNGSTNFTVTTYVLNNLKNWTTLFATLLQNFKNEILWLY